MKKFDKERVLLAVAAPVLALVAAFLLTALVLAATGKQPFDAFGIMIDYGSKSDSQVYILNKGTTYYLSGLAVAIGFRMNLFNIGVDGQYRVAAFFAAVVGGTLRLPGFVQIPLIILVAMLVGGMWASIAGLLKVYRGVSEVISTIMLNSLATSLIGYFLVDGRLATLDKQTNIVATDPLPSSSHFFAIPAGAGLDPVEGFIVVAVLAGVGYWFLLGRTRFGYDLRAVGQSESAAQASGVDVRRMVLSSMVLSGAVAGLVGMPTVLNESYQYTSDFPVGIGFTGIAVALLGRNKAVGILFAALLFGALQVGTSPRQLDPNVFNPELATNLSTIIQALIILFVGAELLIVYIWQARKRVGFSGPRRVEPELKT
jgi:general nucleoside transport system permease protein